MHEVPKNQSHNSNRQYFAEAKMNDAFMSIFGEVQAKVFTQTQEESKPDNDIRHSKD